MRQTFTMLTIMFLGLAKATQGGETALQGDVFPIAGGATPVFTIERRATDTDQGRVHIERYIDPSGRVVAQIEAIYVAGKLSFLKFDQHQLGETSTAEIKDGKATYSHTSDGKTKQTTEKDPGNLVAAPVVPEVIIARWDELQSGKSVEITVPIPARRQSFGIKMTKAQTFSKSGRTFTEFKMEPANPLFRVLGDPIFFVFDNQDKSLTEFRGGTIAKVGSPGNWKDFSGRIVYRSASESIK